MARVLSVGRAALGLAAVLRCWTRDRAARRVAVQAAVCHEVILAILAAGCEPVFCDIDPAVGLTLESEWARARALGADIALVVHLYGNVDRMAAVRRRFSGRECLVIDDAAQALGARGEMGEAGTLGDVGLLSFGRSKQIAVGNAALLFRDEGFAAHVATELETVPVTAEEVRTRLSSDFRVRLDQARARLVVAGDSAAAGFAGLLDGMAPVLNVPLLEGGEARVLSALQDYPQQIVARRQKSALWAHGLAGTGLQSVGMDAGCVPWRHTCRLPAATWARQQSLSERLRAAGLDVSNWYLPAHWFLGRPAGSLPGVETLAREVFQFWVDESLTEQSIAAQATTARREMSR